MSTEENDAVYQGQCPSTVKILELVIYQCWVTEIKHLLCQNTASHINVL